MLAIAFKEWAVICQALAEGRQALILRKGGIAEVGGEFRPEHSRFWLYPTYLHEHRSGIKPDALPLFDAAEAERPPAGTIRLTHFAEVAAVLRVEDWAKVVALDDLHVWPLAAVRMKFDYRTPGLYVLPVRVYWVAQSVDLAETPEYAGCKTWVELGQELPTEDPRPAIGGQDFERLTVELHQRVGS